MARYRTVYKGIYRLETHTHHGSAKTYVQFVPSLVWYPTPFRGKTTKESILKAVGALEKSGACRG